jgi:hypothetical protein
MLMNNRLLFSICVGLIALSSQTGENRMHPHSVIFTAEGAERAGWFADEAPFWTPTQGQTRDLDSLLQKYLDAHPPTDDRPVVNVLEYGRQYLGVTKNRRKLIHLNAFCRPDRFAPRWEKELIIVRDGGSCYFQIYFDPAKKEFLDLLYNGNA